MYAYISKNLMKGIIVSMSQKRSAQNSVNTDNQQKIIKLRVVVH